MRSWVRPVVLLPLLMVGCKIQQAPDLSEIRAAEPPKGEHKGMYDDFEGGVWSGATCQGANKGVATHRQSPIVIDPDKFRGKAEKVKMRYAKANASVVDNGHTIQANFPADYIKDGSGSIKLDDVEFVLHQLHFHTRSEHQLKDGKDAEMELHLVHKTRDKKKAVALGFFIEQGTSDNEAVKSLWTSLGREADKRKRDKASAKNETPTYDEVYGLSGTELPLGSAEIDVAALIAPGLGKGYYTYEGSLTTPPCDEIVTHMVALAPLSLSAAQIKLFREFHAKNARPTQDAGADEVRRYRLIKD